MRIVLYYQKLSNNEIMDVAEEYLCIGGVRGDWFDDACPAQRSRKGKRLTISISLSEDSDVATGKGVASGIKLDAIC